MHESIDEWLTELVKGVNEARASDVFEEWLDVQSRFHDYSARNTLLISLQCPDATHVAGYRAWQTEFDRHVKEGEEAIWIWAPIITSKCPECGNSPSYHAGSDCTYEETEPEAWAEGLVGFTPSPVFDVSQTEGEPLPELDTAACGESGDLVPALLAAADDLDLSARVVPEVAWSHGGARGVCQHRAGAVPVVEVVARENDADLARTLVHEYAHALLHDGVDAADERAKREVEAESVAYVVGRACDLDVSGSMFYLAVWTGEETDVILERLNRISRTAATILQVVDTASADACGAARTK